MPDYKKMYILLFNSITDALEELKKQNIGTAKELLKGAQQAAEELYVEQCD